MHPTIGRQALRALVLGACIIAASVPVALAQSCDPNTRDCWCEQHQSDPSRCLTPGDVASVLKSLKSASTGSVDAEVGVIVAVGAASGQPEVVLAGEVFKTAVSLFQQLGAFDTPDPVAIAFDRLQGEINAIEGQIQGINHALQSLSNRELLHFNMNNVQFLSTWQQKVDAVKFDLTTKVVANDAPAMMAQINDLVSVARSFLPPRTEHDEFAATPPPVWEWSVIQLLPNGSNQPSAIYLDPAFEHLPTLRYYTATLVTLMAAIEWAVKNNFINLTTLHNSYLPDLYRHADFLSIRNDWRPVGYWKGKDPVTVPERLSARVSCNSGAASPSPVNGACRLEGMCTVYGGSSKFEGLFPFRPLDPHDTCMTIQYPADSAAAQTAAEDAANRAGVAAMLELADRLRRLANSGSASKCDWSGVFNTSTSYEKHFLYALKPNGQLLWHDDLVMTVDPTKMQISDANPCGSNPTANRDTNRYDRATGIATAPQSVAGYNPGSAARNSMLVNPALRGNAGAPIRPQVAAPGIGLGIRTVHRFEGPKLIANNWQVFKGIIPAGGSDFYGLTPTGRLQWYRYLGFNDGSMQVPGGKSAWLGPVDAGGGWNAFSRVIAGGDGVLYAIAPDGSLHWYRNFNAGRVGQMTPNWSAPVVVGSGWGQFANVFSAGAGIIYAVTPDGRLLWYRYKGHLTGAVDCSAAGNNGVSPHGAGVNGPNSVNRAFGLARGGSAAGSTAALATCWEGPKQVGSGWAGIKRIFSDGTGRIYAVQPGGNLLWYRHLGYQDGSVHWEGPTLVSAGWNAFATAFSSLPSSQGPVIN